MPIKTFKISLQLLTTFILILSASFKLNAIVFSHYYDVHFNGNAIASIEKKNNESEFKFTVNLRQTTNFTNNCYSEITWFPNELLTAINGLQHFSIEKEHEKEASPMNGTPVFFMGQSMEDLFNQIIEKQSHAKIQARVYSNFTFMNSWDIQNFKQIKPFVHTIAFAPILRDFTHESRDFANFMNNTNQKVTYQYKIDSKNKIIESITVYDHNSQNTLLFSAVTTNFNDCNQPHYSSATEYQQLPTNTLQHISPHSEAIYKDNLNRSKCKTNQNEKLMVLFCAEAKQRADDRRTRRNRSIAENPVSKYLDNKDYCMVKIILRNNVKIAENGSESDVLEIAARRSDLDILKFLKNHVDKKHISINPFNILEESFTSTHVIEENEELLIQLFDHSLLSNYEKKALIYTICNKHTRSFHHQYDHEYVAISRFRRLLAIRGFNDFTDKLGLKLCFYMAEKKDLEGISNTVMMGSEVTFYNLSDEDKNEFFHRSIKNKDLLIIKHLLLTMNVYFNIIDHNLFDSIFNIAINEKDLELIKYIISQLNNSKQSNIYNITHLINAINSGSQDIIEYLIEQKSHINALEQGTGMTPLHYAAGISEGVTLLLINKGANVNALDQKGNSPLCFAINKDIAITLVEKNATLDIKTACGGTLIHHAVGHDNIELLEYFISQHLDIKCIDNNKVTPLHVATYSLYTDMVEYLLTTKHVDVNATDHSGRTSLDIVNQKTSSEYTHLNSSMEYDLESCCNNDLENADELLQELYNNASSEISKILIKAGGMNAIDLDVN